MTKKEKKIHQSFRYLVPRPEDSQWGITINTAGFAQVPPDSSYPPPEHPQTHEFNWTKGRILNEYQLVYINKGKGIFESESAGKHKIESGTLFIVFEGEWHRYKPTIKVGWDEYWIGLSGETAKSIFKSPFFFPESPFFKIGNNRKFVDYFFDLINTVNNQKNPPGCILSANAMSLLAELYQSKDKGSSDVPHAQRKVNQAKAYIAEHYKEEISHEDLAKELGISYTKFRRDFKHYTGMPPNQYLHQTRLEHAKKLLTYTSMPVQEIAMNTGFQSAYYFSRAFKKHFNVSPSHLRQ